MNNNPINYLQMIHLSPNLSNGKKESLIEDFFCVFNKLNSNLGWLNICDYSNFPENKHLNSIFVRWLPQQYKNQRVVISIYLNTNEINYTVFTYSDKDPFHYDEPIAEENKTTKSLSEMYQWLIKYPSHIEVNNVQ